MSTGQDVRKLYYSAAWQLIEEHVDDFETSSGSFTKERVMQQFWGLRYIDDAVMRRIDSNADGDYSDAGDRTYFHITDVQFSSVALIDDAANLVERVSYDAYGRARHRPLGDIDGDGDVDGTSGSPGTGDQGLFDAAATTYNVDADFDRDLDTSSDTEDTAIFTAAHVTAALAVGRISDNSLDGPDNPVGYDGYLYNPEIEMYTVRFRHYHPEYGRWWRRDPAEYVDGMNGYLGFFCNPASFVDPLGQMKRRLAWEPEPRRIWDPFPADENDSNHPEDIWDEPAVRDPFNKTGLYRSLKNHAQRERQQDFRELMNWINGMSDVIEHAACVADCMVAEGAFPKEVVRQALNSLLSSLPAGPLQGEIEKNEETGEWEFQLKANEEWAVEHGVEATGNLLRWVGDQRGGSWMWFHQEINDDTGKAERSYRRMKGWYEGADALDRWAPSLKKLAKKVAKASAVAEATTDLLEAGIVAAEECSDKCDECEGVDD